MIDYLWHDYHGMTVESVLINCHYPVTPTSFMLQWGVIVKRPPGLTDDQAARFGAKFGKFVGVGFEQDVEIWLHKSRVDNPLLCAEDGPVYQLRRWYEQFYRDVGRHRAGHGRQVRVRDRHQPAPWRAGRRRSRGTWPPAAGARAASAEAGLRWPGPPPSAPTTAMRSPQPVECARCGACVEVAKFSPQHTSVQWTAAAARCCAEFRARGAPAGTGSALIEGCAALRDSIDAAVAAGRLAVTPPSYEQAREASDSARLLQGAGGGGDPGDW